MNHAEDRGHLWRLRIHVLLWIVLLSAAAVWLTLYLIGTLQDPLAGRRSATAKKTVCRVA